MNGTTKFGNKTFSILADQRVNNFDFLRFLAASLVIVNHSFSLSGSTFEPFVALTRFDTLGALAVDSFFIMSGFLIVKSWADHQRTFAFIGKRVVRIFPALIAATLLTVFIIGPAFTSLWLKEYFSNPGTWDYLWNMTLLKTVFELPGVFTNTPLPRVVNGSLWTLPYEFIMYLVVLCLGLLGILKKRWLLVLAVAVLILFQGALLYRPVFESYRLGQIVLPWMSNLAIFFLVGSLFFLFRKNIPVDGRIAIVFLVLYVLTFRQPVYLFAKYLFLPYLVLFVAQMKLGRISNFGKHGDFSYGMYVYAFPIQQAIMQHTGGVGPAMLFLLAFPITLLLSVFSWHVIEKPALALKRSFSRDRYPTDRRVDY